MAVERLMNVLVITNMCASPQNPYQGKFVRNQVEAIDNTGEVDVDYFEMPKEARDAGGFLKRYLLFLLAFFKGFIFSRKTFDIIHVHFFFPTIVLAYCYKLFRNPKVKLIATFHGSDIYHYEPPNKAYRFLFSKLDHAIFVSEPLMQRCALKAKSMSIISAGIADEFAPIGSNKEFDLIFVGTLDENKGIQRLFDILDSVQNTSLNIAIAGEGPLKKVTTERANQSSHKVTLLGYVEQHNLIEVYSKSRYLINLSANESFGLVLTEAMACGVPVIATATDGGKAQIKESKNGYLLPCASKFSANDWATILRKILSNNDYKSLSENAILCGQQQKLSVVANKVISVYREILNK